MSPRAPTGSIDVQGRVLQHVFQYGAVGLLLAAIVWKLFAYGDKFVPVLITRFEDDRKTQVQQTVTQQQILGALIDLRTEMKKGNEICAGAVSVSCVRKR